MGSESGATFHLAVSPESARRLTELAEEAGFQREVLLCSCIEEWLCRPRVSLTEAAAYVLTRHANPFRDK